MLVSPRSTSSPDGVRLGTPANGSMGSSIVAELRPAPSATVFGSCSPTMTDVGPSSPDGFGCTGAAPSSVSAFVTTVAIADSSPNDAGARIDVVGYADDAAGVMPAEPTPMRITRIELRPRITVRGTATEDRLRHLCEVAHHECFIANSLTTEIIVSPTFTFVT